MFPKKEVNEILEPGFVEARLNTDLKSGHPHFKYDDRIQKLRVQYLGAGNTGLPQYLVFDPNRLETPIATRAGSAAIPVFVEFFRGAKGQ